MTVDVSSRPRRITASRGDRWLAAATAAAALPVVVATVAALAGGWVAVGDNGYFLLRSRDVLTAHTPLLGTWTSSSLELDLDVNNPGPMLFYLFAIPVKIGESGGLAVAAATLNLVSILGIAYALRRNAGPLVAVLGLVAAAGLGWSMGRPLLFDPWQPHSLLYPFLLFLVLAWVAGAGDRWALPWAAAVASLLVQTHLTYVYVVPAVGAVAVVGLAWRAVTVRRTDRDRWHEERARQARVGVVTAAVLVICWLPPLLEQVFVSGRGNLTRLVDAARSGAPTVGFEEGVRRSSEVLAIPPTWLRPSLDAEQLIGEPVGLLAGVLALAALTLVLVGAGGWAWRRRDLLALVGVAVAGVAMLTGVFTATGLIQTQLGVAAHHVRYLWPIALIVQLAVAVAVIRGLGEKAQRRILPVATVAVIALAAANLPSSEHSIRTNPDLVAPAIRAMNEQLDALDDRGTVLVTFDHQPLGEPFGGAFLAELGRRGVDFVVDTAGGTRQLGPRRAYEGEADARVFLRWGRAALEEQEGARRVVLASVLDDDEIDDWHRARAAVLGAIDRGEVELTAEGRAAARRGDLIVAIDDGELDPDQLRFTAETAAFMEALEQGWIRVGGVPATDVDAWIELNSLLAYTVSVWVTDEPGWRT